jgi:hypothetical protein
MATTPTPTPSATYPGITGTNPVAGGNLTQGDMPIYAQPGPSNIIYGASYASSLAAGGTPDLVGWSFARPAGGLISGLSQTLGRAGQGGLTYYTLPGALEQWGQMTPDQRTTVQKQLLAAGMYAAEYYPSASGAPASKKPLYGAAADFGTINALSQAWTAAKDTGQTLDTVLNQANVSAMNAARIYQQNTQVGQFDMSDPAEIRGLADQQAISVLGRKATNDEKALAVSMVQAAQVAYQQGKFNQTVGANRADLAVQLAGGIGAPMGGPGSSIAGTAAPASVNALVSALGGQESGSPAAGGYTAVNPVSGATGRFQIMPSNWPSWSQAAGLGPNAPMTPQNQEIVARNQISQYLSDGGGDPTYVAVAWYAGEAEAKAFQADPTNPKWKVPQAGGNPSIYDYAQSVVGKMAAAVPGNVAAQAAATTPPVGGPGGPANAGSINVGQGGAGTSLAGEVGSINVGQTPTAGAIPPTGSLAGEVGSIGATAGAAGATGLTGVNTAGTIAEQVTGQPTPAQLLPTSTQTFTQVNPTADLAELLRRQNPLGASAHDMAQILDAVRAMFHG